MDHRLRVLAVLAEDVLRDEAVEIVLKLARFMGAVDDPAVVLGIDIGLSTELEAKIFDDITWRTRELVGHVAQIDDNSLDAVTFALDLGLETFHLVAVEGISDIAANVDIGHCCGIAVVVAGWEAVWTGGIGRWRSLDSSRGESCQRHTVDTRSVCYNVSGDRGFVTGV